MQMERQVFLFCTIMGGALAYPEVRMLAVQPDYVAGGTLMTAGGFGALAAFFGTLLAVDYDPPWFKALAVGFWGAVSLVFAAAMQYGALRSPGTVRLGLFEFFCALDLMAFFGTHYSVWRVQRRSKAAG